LVDTAIVDFYGPSQESGRHYYYIENLFTGDIDSLLSIGGHPIVMSTESYPFYSSELGWFRRLFELSQNLDINDSLWTLNCRSSLKWVAADTVDFKGFGIEGKQIASVRISDLLTHDDVGLGYIVLKYGKSRGLEMMYAGLYHKVGESWSLVKWEKASM